MTTQEMATEIVKVWLSRSNLVTGSGAETEIRKVYLATVQTILDSFELKSKKD